MKHCCCWLLLFLCCSYTTEAKRRTAKKKKETAAMQLTQELPKTEPDPFAQSDRITFFESQILVKQNGKLEVTEHITIYNGDGSHSSNDPDFLAAGGGNDAIKRGIIRTFPTKYVNQWKLFQNTTFDLEEVLLDGTATAYTLKGPFGNNGYTLQIGDPTRYLDKGSHTYTIRYQTQHQVKFGQQYDELAWNVTGNGWGFRIDSARCTIVIPRSDSVFSNACYTGPQDYNTAQCSFTGRADTIVFRTTKAMSPYEGFTVATSWRKGIIAPPSSGATYWWMLKNNIGALGMPLLWIIILLYNTLKWWRHGRDLRPGTIVVQYDPPPGLSPAAMGYIYFQKMQNRLLAATITDLALRNLFRIEVRRTGIIFKDNEYVFRRSDLEFIPAGYEDFKDKAKDLMGTSISKGHYNSDLGSLQKKISRELGEQYEGRSGKKKTPYFLLNARFLVLGYLLSILPFIVLLFLVLFDVKTNPWALIPLGGGFLLCLITQAVFSQLMMNYTKEGRKVKDLIEGYRRYLKTVDENRLNMMNPPEKTIDLYEKNLAFAIALNCEVEWGKKFEGIIDSAIQDGTAHAGLYYGSNFHSGSGFSGSTFASSFGSAISSASTPPSSSSSGGGSSFGGGSSGGGGGGGGGGGW